MLHDIKARYFGNGLGWVFNMMWPLGHMAVILAMNSGRIAPYGDSIILYAATGVIPFMAFNYPSRFLVIGTMNNKVFLQYPIVNVFDILISRAILEMISFAIVCFSFSILLILIGIDITPVNLSGAVSAIICSVLLGIGFGFLNSLISLLWTFWVTASILIIIVFWATCGLLLNVNQLPQPWRYLISFNPTLHAVEWMRMSYYPGYTSIVFDKTYLINCAIYSFAIGVVGIKAFELRIRRAV